VVETQKSGVECWKSYSYMAYKNGSPTSALGSFSESRRAVASWTSHSPSPAHASALVELGLLS